MQNRHSHVPISQCDCMLQITVFTFHCYQLVLFFKKRTKKGRDRCSIDETILLDVKGREVI